MRFYEEPSLEIVEFEVEDVVTTSGTTPGGENETPDW